MFESLGSRVKGLTMVLALVAIPLKASSLLTEQPTMPFHNIASSLFSGRHDGSPGETNLVFKETVHVPDAKWLRLVFGDYHLGKGSYIMLVAQEDGAWQRLEATSIEQWGGSSAFFNGDTVDVELHVAADDREVYVSVDEVSVGEQARSQHAKVTDDCPPDVKVASNDPAVGRILVYGGVVFGTGWIASNQAIVTASHVVRYHARTIEFNVPLSDPNGNPVFAHPNDQYAIDLDTVLASPCSELECAPGNDWAMFVTYPNSNTGLSPHRAQEAFYRVTRDQPEPGYGPDMCITGFSRNRDNPHLSFAQQTHCDAYLSETALDYPAIEIRTNAAASNASSGAPMSIEGTNVSVGVLKGQDSQSCHEEERKGTGFENDSLELALHSFPAQDGELIWYVDNGHHWAAQRTGAVVRPFLTVSDAVSSSYEDDTISIVAGSYPESVYIDHAVSIVAPVGPVIIGE